MAETSVKANRTRRRRRPASGEAGVGLAEIAKVIQAALAPINQEIQALKERQEEVKVPSPNVMPMYERPEDRLKKFQEERAAAVRGLTGPGQATSGTMTRSSNEMGGAAPVYHPGDAARNIDADVVVFTADSEKGQAIQRARAHAVRRHFAETVFEKPFGKLDLQERKALEANEEMLAAIRVKQAEPFPLGVIASVLYRDKRGEWKYKIQFPELGKRVMDAARESELARAN